MSDEHLSDQHPDEDHRFCASVMLDGETPPDEAKLSAHKAAVLKANMWSQGDVITVRFLEGDAALQKKVMDVAKEWIKPKGPANLTFDFRTKGPTDIRIAFRQGAGSWSYNGTYCRKIPEPQPTMNYGWLTPSSPADEIRRVVLHEFGHALGLIHEHQNPKKPIKWNKPAVIHDLAGPPNNWDPATIENNMFKRYKEKEVMATPVDATSIMMYPIPKAWTLDGFHAEMNDKLSARDVQLIQNAYP